MHTMCLILPVSRGVQKYPIRNIRSENPPIQSEISDIRSDFKISDRVSGKNFGFSDRIRIGIFQKFQRTRSENPVIRSENPVIRSEKFGYPKISDRIRIAIFPIQNFRISEYSDRIDPISDIEHPYQYPL